MRKQSEKTAEEIVLGTPANNELQECEPVGDADDPGRAVPNGNGRLCWKCNGYGGRYGTCVECKGLGLLPRSKEDAKRPAPAVEHPSAAQAESDIDENGIPWPNLTIQQWRERWRTANNEWCRERNDAASLRMMLEKESLQLRQVQAERDEARRGLGAGNTRPHEGPDGCPTYYDGCHCTVEVLRHNIERADSAEAKLAVTTEALREQTALLGRLLFIVSTHAKPTVEEAESVFHKSLAILAPPKDAEKGVACRHCGKSFGEHFYPQMGGRCVMDPNGTPYLAKDAEVQG